MNSTFFDPRFGLEYYVHDFWAERADPRTALYPVISDGPWFTLGIIFLYLFIIKALGQFMENRKAYDVKKVMLIYNVVNIAWNVLIVAYGLHITNFGATLYGCRDYTESRQQFVWLGYSYFLNKCFDFFDTFFFVLRKKNSQITFLHVTHHCILPLTVYIAMKYAPFDNSLHTVVINSFVHVVMYFYYFLAALGPQMEPYLWWKKHITKLQLLQFLVAMVHGFHVFVVPNCNYPRVLSLLEMSEATYFFVVFMRFYIRSYKSVRVDAKVNGRKSLKPIDKVKNPTLGGS